MGRTKSLRQRRVTVNVCLDGDLLAELDAAAEAEGLSRSALLARLIRAALGQGEPAASAPDPRERIPWDEVKGRLGQ